MTPIIEVRNGRPRVRKVNQADLDWLAQEPSFYGEIVKLTGFGAEVRRPNGTIEQVRI